MKKKEIKGSGVNFSIHPDNKGIRTFSFFHNIKSVKVEPWREESEDGMTWSAKRIILTQEDGKTHYIAMFGKSRKKKGGSNV